MNSAPLTEDGVTILCLGRFASSPPPSHHGTEGVNYFRAFILGRFLGEFQPEKVRRQQHRRRSKSRWMRRQGGKLELSASIFEEGMFGYWRGKSLAGDFAILMFLAFFFFFLFRKNLVHPNKVNEFN